MNQITLDKNGLANTSGVLTIYNFDANTGEYTGATDEYLEQGVGIPGDATVNAPPAVTSGNVAIFTNNSWQLISDHRGESVYSTTDGTLITINEPGEYPAGTTVLKPATPFDKWDGTKWVTDGEALQAAAINLAENEKTARISEANTFTQAWQTQLLLGIIAEADKISLTEWMEYVQQVQSVDTSKAPISAWPTKPERS